MSDNVAVTLDRETWWDVLSWVTQGMQSSRLVDPDLHDALSRASHTIESALMADDE